VKFSRTIRCHIRNVFVVIRDAFDLLSAKRAQFAFRYLARTRARYTYYRGQSAPWRSLV
jgi:hypothetical protein